jgi:hypothetical protein
LRVEASLKGNEGNGKSAEVFLVGGVNASELVTCKEKDLVGRALLLLVYNSPTNK